MTRVQTFVDLLLTDQNWRDPNPSRSHVTAIQHALQAATRALRHSKADHQMVTAALLHDAARPLSDVHHGEVIALALRDVVRPAVFEALYDHGVYQEALLHPERRLNPTPFPEATNLAAWDAASFDPDFPTPYLGTFLPYLERTLQGA